MRILFDHGTPAPLRSYLPGYQIDTARERGWETLDNGDLLDEAERNGYEMLLTADQSIRYQQNLMNRRIAILVLMNNAWPEVRLQTDIIQEALGGMQPGEYREVDI